MQDSTSGYRRHFSVVSSPDQHASSVNSLSTAGLGPTTLSVHITRGWSVDQLYGMALKLDSKSAVATLGYAKYLRQIGQHSKVSIYTLR